MSLLKTTIKTSVWKALSLFLDLGRNFLFIKTLSVEAFGLLSLGNNLIQSNKYLDFGFTNKFLIDSYDSRFKDREAKKVFYSIIVFEFFLLALFGSGFLLIFSDIKRTINIDGTEISFGIFFPLIILMAFFSARMYKLSLVWRRHKKKFEDIAILEVCFSIFLLSCSFLSLILDFYSFLNSYFFLQGIIFLVISVSVFKIFLKTKLQFKWLSANWKPSLLLTSATFLYGLSFYFDRFILVTYYGLTEIGNYSFLLFILGLGSAIITYGLQPIRAHIASSFADGEDYTRKKIILDICKKTGLYMFIVGVVLITLFVPVIKYWMLFLFSKYDEAIIELHNIFNIILTMPALNLLGYLVVAKPFNKTGIFAFFSIGWDFLYGHEFFNFRK